MENHGGVVQSRSQRGLKLPQRGSRAQASVDAHTASTSTSPRQTSTLTPSDTTTASNTNHSSSPAQPAPAKAHAHAQHNEDRGSGRFSGFRAWFPFGNSAPSPDVSEQTPETRPPPQKCTATLRCEKLARLVEQENVDIKAVRDIGWFGLDDKLRPRVWQFLLEYLPANRERQEATQSAKRQEYRDCVPQYFDVSENDRTAFQTAMHKQILVDAPRTTPGLPIFQTDLMQKSLVRVLYIWAIRHPASGYVQGIIDLAVPFMLVFLSTVTNVSMDADNVSCLDGLTDDDVLNVEADVYWCVSAMMHGIQDNYTFAQPGIQRMVFKLQELVTRLDAPLVQHLEKQKIEFIHFAFRWMNCLLVRELPIRLVVRLWDTYLSDPEQNLAVLHVYICAAVLIKFSSHIQTMEFQELMTFVQNLPTSDWNEQDLDMITAQAYVWKAMFESAPSHLSSG